MMLNGYVLEDLISNYFSKLPTFTRDTIVDRLNAFRVRISEESSSIFISIGENCGPGTRMRGAGINTLGSNFFDNIVIRVEDLPNVFKLDFCDVLSLSNLSVGTWEGNDSVYDNKHNIFFHHYFYLPGRLEKERHVEGRRVRAIAREDIPLFLSAVRSQFEYLAEKLRIISRCEREKIFVIRQAEGKQISSHCLDKVSTSLRDFGAVNFKLLNVHSSTSTREECRSAFAAFYIPEQEERWGKISDWARMASAII